MNLTSIMIALTGANIRRLSRSRTIGIHFGNKQNAAHALNLSASQI
jgi:hypothetical protein